MGSEHFSIIAPSHPHPKKQCATRFRWKSTRQNPPTFTISLHKPHRPLINFYFIFYSKFFSSLLIHSDFMRSLISKMDFRSLEMKLYKAKVCFLSVIMIFIIKMNICHTCYLANCSCSFGNSVPLSPSPSLSRN